MEALKRLKAKQAVVRLALGEAYDPRGFVFATHNGRPLRTRNLFVQDFYPIIQRAGVPRIRIHDLKHTTARFLIGLNVDPETAALILGHHEAFTLSVYTSAIGDGSTETGRYCPVGNSMRNAGSAVTSPQDNVTVS